MIAAARFVTDHAFIFGGGYVAVWIVLVILTLKT